MTRPADVEVSAAVRARRLLFRDRPRVTLRGGEIQSRRSGLPRPVRPGVLYERVRAASRVLDRL